MPQHRNALASAASAYLRSAMHQPVDWNEWSEAAFAKAEQEDKPILLDIGAVWCHWCHVMDRESYENPELAELINKFFIPIKVDRDERPDVDTRYQAAVASISGQGGWPLTAFLTPQGLPYFGGTYFPPEDRHGRPGLRRVLFTMAEAFQKQRGDVDETAASVIAAIEHNESFNGRAPDPASELVAKLVASALQQFDPRHGGFGSQPKFPHPGTIDLLLDAAAGSTEIAAQARHAALVTLEKMAQGGIYDHLAGGFHRYSTDERWVVPHFEKMSYDNSELLRNYVHAFQSSGDSRFAQTAREIVGWVDTVLSDREHGGFYASQDADFSLDDDGDYFTWTLAEAEAVLTPKELAVAAPFYDIGEVGDMHHNPARNVLHITKPLPEGSHQLLASAKAKLHAARLARPTPFVDQTVYTGWNGMMVSAYLEASRVLDLPGALAFALQSLDRILAEAWDPAIGLAHVVAYSESAAAAHRVAGGTGGLRLPRPRRARRLASDRGTPLLHHRRRHRRLRHQPLPRFPWQCLLRHRSPPRRNDRSRRARHPPQAAPGFTHSRWQPNHGDAPAPALRGQRPAELRRSGHGHNRELCRDRRAPWPLRRRLRPRAATHADPTGPGLHHR